MPSRRWLLFCSMLVLSCIASVGPVIFFLIADPGFFRRGPRYIGGRMMGGAYGAVLSLLEPILVIGLIRRRYWAWYAGIGYYAPKAFFAAGTAIGTALSMLASSLPLWMVIPLAVLWLGVTLFLYIQREWFDQ